MTTKTMTKEEFIEKWLVDFSDAKKHLKIKKEMESDLESLIVGLLPDENEIEVMVDNATSKNLDCSYQNVSYNAKIRAANWTKEHIIKKFKS